MFHKSICLLLTLVLCIALCSAIAEAPTDAQAAEGEGLLGICRVSFFPFSVDDPATEPSAIGLDTFLFIMDKPNVQVGQGAIEVHSAADESVVIAANPESFLVENVDGYTHVSFVLDAPLQTPGEYYLTMAEGAFTLDGISSNPITIDTNLRTTILDCGWGTPYKTELAVGETFSQSFILGSAARLEAVVERGGIISLDKTELTEDGEIQIQGVSEGEVFMQVTFYDENGEVLTWGDDYYTVTEQAAAE